MNEPQDELESARQLGRLRAERLDFALREEEQREREMRFVHFAWEEGVGSPPPPAGGGEMPGKSEIWRLQQELERLTAFHQAVLHSRAWQLIQWVRRPFGRVW
jgi:hypothetical protein